MPSDLDPNPSDEALQTALADLNKLAFGPSPRLRLEYVDIDELREQDVNANAMPADMFNALVSNIKNNEALESVPLCATRAGSEVREIVSGHHRIRAGRKAGVKRALVLTYQDLTDSEIKAKQLAHNAISGTSDPQLILDIYNSIGDLSNQIESYIDPAQLAEAARAPSVPFQPLDIDPMDEARMATFFFLPTQLQDIKKAMDSLGMAPDVLYVGSRETYDQFRDAVHRVRLDCEVYSLPTALTTMAHIVLEHLDGKNVEELSKHVLDQDQQRKLDAKRTMPLASLLGTDRIPMKEARAIQAALDKAAAAKGWAAHERWKVLKEIGHGS
jgi:ParB-like nuclease domain